MCPDLLGGTSYCGGIPQSVCSPTFAATPLHGGMPPEESITSYRSGHFFRSVGPPDCNHNLESELHSLWQDTHLGISSCLSHPLSSFRFTLGLCSQKLEQTDPQGLWFMASVQTLRSRGKTLLQNSLLILFSSWTSFARTPLSGRTSHSALFSLMTLN